MALQNSSLRSFLVTAKSTLHSAIINQQRVTLVVGNESADLDSITSSILLAYLRSNPTSTPINNPSVNRHTPTYQYPPLYIPILNIPRSDIRIRPELLKLLPHVNIEPSHLITLDDLSADPPAGLNPSGREFLQPQFTRLVLTDHNKLAGPLVDGGFAKCVVGCIDHHIDETTIPQETGSEPRVIRKAGSCTSLVLEYCKQIWDQLSDSASNAQGGANSGQSDVSVGIDDSAVRRTWDAQVAKLALASVLIDTTGLRSKDKTEDVDRWAADYLEMKIRLAPGAAGARFDRDEFLDELHQAKGELDGLSSDDLLRKDYKQWEVNGRQLGVSSVVKTLSWQIEKAGGVEGFRKTLDDFAAKRSLDIVGIMTTSTSKDGNFQRELLLQANNQESNKIVLEFATKQKDEFGLEEWREEKNIASSGHGHGNPQAWWQREVKYSRKQVAPAIRKSMESVSS